MRVLHLEDSDLDAEATAMGLFKTWPECYIQRASTRVQFQAALERGGFDLILSDYTMLGFDGLSALELAGTYCPEKPFIFLSGTIGEERAIEALNRGATDYVLKDRSARLVPAMKRALARVEETQRHRKMENALRLTRENFRHIAENVSDIVMMSDLEGRRLYCNPAYYASVGRLNDQHFGADVFADVYADDRELVETMFRQTVQTGAHRRVEYRLVRADQTLRRVEAQNTAVRDETGVIVKVLVFARDITAQHNAENRLRQQAALLDQAQDAILVRDINDHITYWNQSAARIYGWSPEEADGRAVAALWEEDVEQAAAARRLTLLCGEWRGEMRQRTKAGETFIMQSRWTRVGGSDGVNAGFFVINTDITEKKRLEAQVLSAQRTESIGLLAGGLAHDINNLLVPVLCSAEMLESMVSGAEAKRFVSMIRSSAQYGAALVQQLLAFARGVPSQKTEVGLPALLSGLREFVAQSFGPAYPLALSLPHDSWPVWADATQLKQVIMNLCINARDSMPNGGCISISLSNLVLDGMAAVALQKVKSGPHVAVKVTDKGTGIPPANLQKIFDPFFTTKEVGKGIGLGLAAVRGLVQGHDGAIVVESELGRGSTFTVYLPAFLPVKTPGKRDAVQPARAQGSGQGILLVDDEASLREILYAILTSNGYRVFKADSGKEALALLEIHHADIELVLTDITMPGMDGFALIENLRSRVEHLPIVAISGMTGLPFFEEKAYDLDVPLLAKPVSKEILLATIAAALAAPSIVY